MAEKEGKAIAEARQKAEQDLKYIQGQLAGMAKLEMVPEEQGTKRQAARLNNAGVKLLDSGSFNDAIAKFREAIALYPAFYDAHINLGLALDRQEKPKDAMIEFRKTINLQPNHFLGHYNLGATLCDIGETKEAINELQEAIQLKPDFSLAYGDVPELVEIY